MHSRCDCFATSAECRPEQERSSKNVRQIGNEETKAVKSGASRTKCESEMSALTRPILTAPTERLMKVSRNFTGFQAFVRKCTKNIIF